MTQGELLKQQKGFCIRRGNEPAARLLKPGWSDRAGKCHRIPSGFELCWSDNQNAAHPWCLQSGSSRHFQIGFLRLTQCRSTTNLIGGLSGVRLYDPGATRRAAEIDLFDFWFW